jgi:hypothetical protein
MSTVLDPATTALRMNFTQRPSIIGLDRAEGRERPFTTPCVTTATSPGCLSAP